MKKIVSLLIVLLFFFTLTSCKEKNNFKTKEEILESYKYFNANVDINGSVYNLVKSSSGYFMANTTSNVYYYYNIEENRSYSLNVSTKQKILLEGNGIFNNYLDNVYYVLTSHLEKDFSVYEKYTKEYIGQDVTVYSFSKDGVKEEYYIDNVTGGCLYFYINDGTKSITCKFDSIELEDVNLEAYKSYTTLTNVNKLQLRTKEELLTSLNKFDVTFKVNGITIRVAIDDLGMYYQYDENDPLLYVNSEEKWYSINASTSSRSEYIFSSSKKSILESTYSFLIGYIDNINDAFYEKSGDSINGIDVITYQKISMNEIYQVSKENGICLKSYIKGTEVVEYEIIEFSKDVNTQTWLDYKVTEGVKIYKDWPENHKYLEGIAKFTFGSFDIATEDEDGLTLYYEMMTENNFNSVKTIFTEAGFDQNVVVDKNYTGSYYLYYIIEAENSLGYKLTLSYYGADFELIINITE